MPSIPDSLGSHLPYDHELELLRVTGELFLVDALKRRPKNEFDLEKELFIDVRDMAMKAVDTQHDRESVFTDFGFIARPEVIFW